MPPRLNMLFRAVRPQLHSSTASFLAPFLRQVPQQRSASILNTLSDTPGAYNKRIRRGRGASSGKGKTSGRGHKGQKQHGKVPRGFNGGQTPDIVVSGTRGFENQHSLEMSPVSVDRIADRVRRGMINPAHPITVKELHDSHCLRHGLKDGIKLLARGAKTPDGAPVLNFPVNIIVNRASAAAIAAVEAAGGTVTTRYFTRQSTQRVLQGLSHPYYSLQSKMPEGLDYATETAKYKYRLPDPASRKDIEYYRDPAHRGYLSHLVQEGEGPSLFFKVPSQGRVSSKGKLITKSGKTGVKAAKGENRVW